MNSPQKRGGEQTPWIWNMWIHVCSDCRFLLSLPTVCCRCANLWRHINVNLIKWLLPLSEYLCESKKCDKAISAERPIYKRNISKEIMLIHEVFKVDFFFQFLWQYKKIYSLSVLKLADLWYSVINLFSFGSWSIMHNWDYEISVGLIWGILQTLLTLRLGLTWPRRCVSTSCTSNACSVGFPSILPSKIQGRDWV